MRGNRGGFVAALPAPQRRTRSASSKRQPASVSTPPSGVDAGGYEGASGGSEPRSFVVGASKAVRTTQQVTMGSRLEQKGVEHRGAGFRAAQVRARCISPGAGCIAGGLGLELCGFDPRKAPRPFEQKGALQQSQAPAPERDHLRVVAVAAPLLAVSGQAAAVSVHPQASNESAPSEVDGACDLQLEDWSSSEDGNAIVDSDGEEFHYRKYRYREAQACAKPASVEQGKRRGKKVPSTRFAASGDGSDGEGSSPWWTGGEDPLVSSWATSSATHSSAEGRILAEGQEAEQLQRVAQVLVGFYGIPGEVVEAVRAASKVTNVVVVNESAWAQRTRESQLEEPPWMWVRGGRIYDFKGDRGTLAEFEHDLLTRQVEDDSICRTRRLKQGLMPLPFLPLPYKRHGEDQDDYDDDGV